MTTDEIQMWQDNMRRQFGHSEFVDELCALALTSLSALPEALLKEPTGEMIDAGADAFLQAEDAWRAAQPKGYGATCPLVVTLPAAYKAMLETIPSPLGKQ